MKRSAVAIVLTLLSACVCAQTENDRYLYAQLGGAIPVGKLAATAPSELSSGYAVPGGTFKVGYAHYFHRNFGWGARLQVVGLPVNEREMKGRYAYLLQDELESNELEAEAWGVVGVFGSFYARLAPGETAFEWFIRADCGLVSVSSPAAEYAAVPEPFGIAEPYALAYESSSGGALAVGFGVGGRAQLGRFGLLIGGDYLFAQPTLAQQQATFTADGLTVSELEENYSLPVHLIQLNLGATFLIKKPSKNE